MARHITVINGGLSNPSSTLLLAEKMRDAVAARAGARGEELEFTQVDVRDLATDLATYMATMVATPALSRAIDAIAGADGVIAVSPTFSASYSGLFKMLIDALPTDALTNTPVFIGATAGTARHSLMLDFAMRPLFTYLRANVIPTGIFAATDDFGADTELQDRITRGATQFAEQVLQVTAAVKGFVQRPDESAADQDLAAVPDFASLLRGHRG